jgi:hypothetical protein
MADGGLRQVFGPAELCFNALTFVISAWQNYEGMFENLGELLEKCAEFLERLEYYKPKMDARLTRVACQNLQLFVEICDSIIKLRKKHSRFLAFTKQLFLNDNGIQNLLSLMERLNSKESLLVGAQTYKIVSDSAGDIKLILQGQKEQKKDEDAKKWRGSIVKALGFPGASLTEGEPERTWDKALNHRRDRLVDGTGDWLSEDEAFVKWSAPEQPEHGLLILEGEAGAGKTSLMTNALRRLRASTTPSSSPGSRIVTAIYLADSDSKKDAEQSEAGLLESASRALLWQLATSYEAMTRSVAQAVDRTAAFDGSIDMWDRMFVGNKEVQNPDRTFFIFLDGMDSLDSDMPLLVQLLQKLSSTPGSGRKVRVCLTARPKTTATLVDAGKGIGFFRVPVSERNGEDIKRYIESRMDNMAIFKDASRPGIMEWRQRILDTVSEKCEGDYFRMNSILKELSSADLIPEIESILANAGRTLSDQIQRDLQRLNKERTRAEIVEINALIRWVQYGTLWMGVDPMEDIVSLRYRLQAIKEKSTGSTPNGTATGTAAVTDSAAAAPTTMSLSLLPFAQKIQDKYTLFAFTDGGFIDWRTAGIYEQIPKRESGVENSLDGDGALRPNIVREAEVSVVRHFLTTVCPPELYGRFGFEQFFEAKLGAGMKDRICDDADNAHALNALDCLHILLHEELQSNFKALKVAMYSVLYHLRKADLALVDRHLKEEIGPLLVRLLTEAEPLDLIFFPREHATQMEVGHMGSAYCENRKEWIYALQPFVDLSRWFNDSAAVKRVTSEIGQKIVAAAKETSTNMPELLLSYTAKRMAYVLFRGKDIRDQNIAYIAAAIMRGYLVRVCLGSWHLFRPHRPRLPHYSTLHSAADR